MNISRAQTSLALQIVQSGTSMLLGFMLMPALGLAGFGVFTIALAIQLFLLGVVDAGILTPLSVAASRYEAHVAVAFIRRRLIGIVGLVAVLAVLLWGIVEFAGHRLGITMAEHPQVSAAIALGAFALAARECLRLNLLFERHFLRLLGLEALVAVGSVLAVWNSAAERSGNLPAEWPLAIIAVINLVFALGAFLIVSPRGFNPIAIRRLWPLARKGYQSLLAAKVTWLQSQTYLYFVGYLASAAALGTLAAARMLFAPLQSVFTGIVRGMLLDLAGLAAKQQWLQFRSSLKRGYLSLTVLVLAWTVVAIVVFPPVFGWFGAQAFVPEISLVVSWAAVFLVTGLRSTSTVGLKAVGRFDQLLKQGVVGAIIAVLVVPLLVLRFGAIGALWGLLVSELAAFLISLRSIGALPRVSA